MHHHSRATLWQFLLLPLFLGACGSQDDAQTVASMETAAAPATSASSGDSTPTASAIDAVSGADQQFLREMSDHHKGMILLAHETIEQKGELSVKDEARALDKEQDEELDRLHTALRGMFNDDYAARVRPEDQAVVDSLVKLQGAAYSRAFRQNVIRQDEQGVTLIDRYLPRLTQADVKTLAERMRANQLREIEAFKAKLGTQ